MGTKHSKQDFFLKRQIDGGLVHTICFPPIGGFIKHIIRYSWATDRWRANTLWAIIKKSFFLNNFSASNYFYEKTPAGDYHMSKHNRRLCVNASKHIIRYSCETDRWRAHTLWAIFGIVLFLCFPTKSFLKNL